MKKVFIISVFFICMLIVMMVSYLMNPKESDSSISLNNQVLYNNIIDDNIIDENITQTTSEEKTVSYAATLIINKYYKDCQHTITSSVDVPYEMINMSEDEIKEQYPGWQVVEFSENEVSLYKEFEGICNEHYIVSMEDGYIVVYNLDEKMEKALYERTEISTEYLTDGDINDLKNGIEVQGFSKLNALLENYE